MSNETRSKIIAHCLVRNEERFVWYSINSVLPYVDSIYIWDTGSTDKTSEIISTIKSPKVHFLQVGAVDPSSFTDMRNRMLRETPPEFDWLMILDGDEIWPTNAIATATDFCRKNSEYESIVVRSRNLVGDIYHYLPESAGKYQLLGLVGHLNIRFINLKQIPGLHVDRPHGQQGYFDGQNNLIQNRDPKKIKFLDVYYHHATHLARSSGDVLVMKRSPKYKYEIGYKINNVPEIVRASRPDIVPDISAPAPVTYWIKAAISTPAKYLKRLILPSPSGY